MAFYCSDCVTWINSNDGNRYGEKYCDYDRKYRAASQNIYGCRGFVWAKRAIITKICEILGIERTDLFESFDEVKEEVLIPCNQELLIDYNTIAPRICEKLENDTDKKQIATSMLNVFIIPAAACVKTKKYEQAIDIYKTMVTALAHIYGETKEDIKKNDQFKQLIHVRV